AFAQPVLEIERRRTLGVGVDLDIDVEIEHLRPCEAIWVALALPTRDQLRGPTSPARTEPRPGGRPVDLQIGDARRRCVAQLQANAVHLAERALLAVEHLRIEDVANEIDV